MEGERDTARVALESASAEGQQLQEELALYRKEYSKLYHQKSHSESYKANAVGNLYQAKFHVRRASDEFSHLQSCFKFLDSLARDAEEGEDSSAKKLEVTPQMVADWAAREDAGKEWGEAYSHIPWPPEPWHLMEDIEGKTWQEEHEAWKQQYKNSADFKIKQQLKRRRLHRRLPKHVRIRSHKLVMRTIPMVRQRLRAHVQQ